MKKLLSILLCLALLAGCCVFAEEESGFGFYVGDTYTNGPADFTFVLPAGWSFTSVTELEADAAGLNFADSDAFYAAVRKGEQFYVMKAGASDGSTVSVLVTPLSPGNYEVGLEKGERKVLEDAMKSIRETLTKNGATIEQMEVRECRFHGVRKYCVWADIVLYGQKITLVVFYGLQEECLYTVNMFCLSDPADVLNGIILHS